MSQPQRRDDRLAAVRTRIGEHGADAVWVRDPANVRWLSGFTSPEDGSVLVTRDEAWLITDGRYIAQAEAESRLDVEITRAARAWVAETVGDASLAIEVEATTVAELEDLESELGRAALRLRSPIAPLREVKDDDEIRRLRQAAALTDAALAHGIGTVAPGVREIDVALELERYIRQRGGELGFPIVVASGLRSSMPHGVATTKAIEAGELVTIDFGARVEGYTADMTRTFAVGEVSADERALYDAVLEAEQAAVRAIEPGRTGQELEAVAREVLERHDVLDLFPHSLGHGVGLKIHEGPRLSTASDDVLEPGMLVTVEPGTYRPGRYGVRIEDLVLVTADGHEVLSTSDRAFRSLPT